MLEHGNGETENQAKKPTAVVGRAFRGGKSLRGSIILTPVMPRIVLLLGICFWGGARGGAVEGIGEGCQGVYEAVTIFVPTIGQDACP